MPIQSTHSLLRSLGGLDLYLRHVAKPGDVILIDEPEMNAHPATQLAIAEFLAMMVNAGVRVIATTHSPYIVDHLHNLIEASRLEPEAQATFAERFKLQSADAFIPADAVATYHFDLDGTVTDVFDRSDRLIDWSTFGAEADEIGNLYTALLAAQRDG
ncbi:MAG: ATP-binding protein [Myxococcales bacterium]|nr:ATP-binding protein [Myxococcales bacterium]